MAYSPQWTPMFLKVCVCMHNPGGGRELESHRVSSPCFHVRFPTKTPRTRRADIIPHWHIISETYVVNFARGYMTKFSLGQLIKIYKHSLSCRSAWRWTGGLKPGLWRSFSDGTTHSIITINRENAKTKKSIKLKFMCINSRCNPLFGSFK